MKKIQKNIEKKINLEQMVSKKVERSYKDITKSFMNDIDLSYKETINSKSVVKNGKEYFVNKVNKIEFLNREKENAEWFVNKFGGKIEFLPTIQEDGGVSCSDYKYYPKKNKNDWYFLEEKETNGKGKSVFYHSLEDKQAQAEVFLIDCTDSKLNSNEIYEQLDKIFTSKKTQYVDIVIVKNNEDLFGIFEKK